MHFDKRMITLASMSVIIFVKRDLARAALCQHYRRLGFERRKGGNRAFKAFILFASICTVANSLRFSLVFHPKSIMLCIIEPTVLHPPCQPLLNLQPRSLG